jgi:hypothetical protein
MTIARHAYALSQKSCEDIAGLHRISGRTRLVIAAGTVDLARRDPGQA